MTRRFPIIVRSHKRLTTPPLYKSGATGLDIIPQEPHVSPQRESVRGMRVKVGGSIPGAGLGSTALTVVRGMGIKVGSSIPQLLQFLG